MPLIIIFFIWYGIYGRNNPKIYSKLHNKLGWVIANVDEADIGGVKEGDRVNFTVVPFESEVSERVSVSSKAYVGSLHIGHTFASAAIDSPQAGPFFLFLSGYFLHSFYTI